MEMKTEKRTFRVTDDSGFLALTDSDAYEGFVSANWDFPQLVMHFQEQMRQHRLLIWGTDMEDIWTVEVRFEPVQEEGFREQTGSIVVSDGWLLLTNYEALSMAAQFEDVKLPEAHECNQLLQVEPGGYRCRIIQLQDHTYHADADEEVGTERGETDYIIELLKVEHLTQPWPNISWFTI